MPETTNENINISKRTLLTWLVLIALGIFAISGYYWWQNIYNGPDQVFWSMVSNNLSTASSTRHIVQKSDTQILDQYIQIQFGAVNAVRSQVRLTQKDSKGKTTIVKTETIGTPSNDYSRYLSIQTGQKTSDGKAFNPSGIIGVWGKTPDALKGQKPPVQYFNQGVLTLFPFANLNSSQRSQLLNTIKSTQVYDISSTAPKSSSQNGRPVFIYNVNVKPQAYVAMLQQYAKFMGLGDVGIDPSRYSNSQPLKAQIVVDKYSRALLKLSYPQGGQQVTFTDQNLENPISLPTTTIAVDDLQQRVQKSLR